VLPQKSPTVSVGFVQSLAAELSAGKVELPSFPEIAARVRRVLADPRSSLKQVLRVVGSEPALAARLMRMANSASLNRSGRAITDLSAAINRIGYNMVRSAAISFAMAQMRQSNKLAGLESRLKELWQRSTLVAAYAFVLARTCAEVNPDEAMLAGMMHGIGKLHILTRTLRDKELCADPVLLNGVIADWHAAIAKAILENWHFSQETAEAVGLQEDHSNEKPGAADLRDVVAIAIVLAAHAGDMEQTVLALQKLPGALRLGLTEDKTAVVMTECRAEVAALNDALGD
jgi:HD-like signal output (HDOD) protein